MNKNWKMIVKNGMLYGAASAFLFAGLFPMLCISNQIGSDLVMGAISGAVSGLLISLVVGSFDLAFARRESVRGIIVWSGLNPVIGALTGAAVTTAVIITMVQVVGIMGNISVPMIFGVPLCLLVGTPLGIIIGLPIGASWRLT